MRRVPSSDGRRVMAATVGQGAVARARGCNHRAATGARWAACDGGHSGARGCRMRPCGHGGARVSRMISLLQPPCSHRRDGAWRCTPPATCKAASQSPVWYQSSDLGCDTGIGCARPGVGQQQTEEAADDDDGDGEDEGQDGAEDNEDEFGERDAEGRGGGEGGRWRGRMMRDGGVGVGG